NMLIADSRHDSEATMSIEEDLSHFEPDRDSTITIGVFDGVHRGHRHLIGRLVQEARSAGVLAGVLTFKNHPITILRPGVKALLLTDLDERIRLLKELGVDFVVPVRFDRELAGLPSREFLLHLYEKLRMRRLIVGPDFAMGRDRDGTLDTLPAIGESIGFTFEAVDLMTDSVGVVKSTTIRNSIAEGDVSRAARLLGRNFSVSGVVGHGEERGRELGFPTANLELAPGFIFPADGIYAAWAHLDSGSYMAATSIGVRPTFDDGENRTIEAYLLDFSDDIYDQPLRLEFVRRLRGEEKFDTIEALLAQMDEDVRQTREILTDC
ncbi:MAG: bifunctional riboflavin kinase/FAD synthetase, partial [Dehalococcoidia bacterium]|nr:bifunctional riboflavin kinase/FAD synthetase [Dehalococcoidia bacterium]